MSSRRGSISDYPEHLNPFYEGNGKLRFWNFGKAKKSSSFRETLRNTLTFKSFRGKKKDKSETPSSPPELRKHGSAIAPHQRQTLPTTLSPIYSPRNSAGPALPRSRFSERVRQPNVNSVEEVPNGHVLSATPEALLTANPFEENEKVAELKPKKIRRRKRRAPLPPNMVREEGDAAYLGVSSAHNFSKWSLTSVETDVSTYSESERLGLNAVKQEISEIMSNITKEMEKMTDETNNNSKQTKETVDEKPHSDIPDLIASSTEGSKKDEINKSADNVSVNVTSEFVTKERSTDENLNFLSKNNCETVEEKPKRINNCDADENKPSVEEELQSNNSCDPGEIKTCKEKEVQNTNNCDENEIIPSKPECDSHTNSICEESDPKILDNAKYNYAVSAPDLNFNERKSLYIAASDDKLNKSDSLSSITSTPETIEYVDINQSKNVSPPASPRCRTEVNLILTSSALEETKEEGAKGAEVGTESVYHPVPKMRTHKPLKNDLLGSEATESL